MAKINRFNGNLPAFASEALANERTIINDSLNTSDDITQNVNESYKRGWFFSQATDFQPLIQDMNAAMFTISQLIAYIHQMGVPEWNVAQEYHQYSMCSYENQIYSSNVNNNISNIPPTSSTQWRRISGVSSVNGNIGDVSITPSSLNVYTKSESDARYYTKTDSDNRYYTKTQSDARYAPINTVYQFTRVTTLLSTPVGNSVSLNLPATSGFIHAVMVARARSFWYSIPIIDGQAIGVLGQVSRGGENNDRDYDYWYTPSLSGTVLTLTKGGVFYDPLPLKRVLFQY